MSLRRVGVGWLALVALYTALSRADAVSGALGATTRWTTRLSDPGVALVPNRAGRTASTSTTSTTGTTVQPGTGIYRPGTGPGTAGQGLGVLAPGQTPIPQR